jgi:hypothetical protein
MPPKQRHGMPGFVTWLVSTRSVADSTARLYANIVSAARASCDVTDIMALERYRRTAKPLFTSALNAFGEYMGSATGTIPTVDARRTLDAEHVDRFDWNMSGFVYLLRQAYSFGHDSMSVLQWRHLGPITWDAGRLVRTLKVPDPRRNVRIRFTIDTNSDCPLVERWNGYFRHAALELKPEEVVGPTTELYMFGAKGAARPASLADWRLWEALQPHHAAECQTPLGGLTFTIEA